MKDQIIYEDNHLLILNKEAGQLVQGDKTGDRCLLDEAKDFIKIRDNKPGNVFLGLVHRLDRPTSGIVIFAKTSKALSRMTEKFKNREVQKVYWAVIPKSPIPQKDTLVHYLRKNEKNNKAQVTGEDAKNAKRAVLHYEVLKTSDRYQLLEVNLETGRHHQIRAQLSASCAPIKGDLKYGAPRSNRDGSISLHARSVRFLHPTTKDEITLTAEVPDTEPVWKYMTEDCF